MASLLTSVQTSKKNKGFRDINVTPMVDVMLVLLVIFMVTAPMMQQQIEVELPNADSAIVAAFEEPPIQLTINTGGALVLGNGLIEKSALKSALDEMMQGRDDQMIYLRADGANTYAQVFEIMGFLQSIGYPNISLVGAVNAQ